MGIPRTWSEELIVEWLQLQNFLVEHNVPIGPGSRGGRKEADVTGIKLSGSTLTLRHIEIGVCAESEDENFKYVSNKFSEECEKALVSRYKDVLRFEGGVNCTREYIATYIPSRQLPGLKERLEENGIELLSLKEVLVKIFEGVKETALPNRTIPESLWLLKLIETLHVFGLSGRKG